MELNYFRASHQKLEKLQKCLAGSFIRTWASWPRHCEFDFYIGCRDYKKKKSLKKREEKLSKGKWFISFSNFPFFPSGPPLSCCFLPFSPLRWVQCPHPTSEGWVWFQKVLRGVKWLSEGSSLLFRYRDWVLSDTKESEPLEWIHGRV